MSQYVNGPDRKNRFRWAFVIFATITNASLLAGCGAGDGAPQTRADACANYVPIARLETITPSSSPKEEVTLVTITGTGFERCTTKPPVVHIEDTPGVTVVSYTDTKLIIKIPPVSKPTSSIVTLSVTNPYAVNAPTYSGLTETSEYNPDIGFIRY